MYGMATDYVCVDSGAGLQPSETGEWLLSSRGDQRYPVVDGIPILVSRPDALLHAFSTSLNEARSSFEQEKDLLSPPPGAPLRAGTRQRIERMLHAKEHNLAVLEKYMQPVRTHLAKQRITFDAVDMLATTISHRTQWWMFSYFHQDWGNTRPFAEVATLVSDALQRLTPDAERLVVLGTGAAGLVRECAPHFHHTYGADLSVPCLLLANAMFRGHALHAYLERSDWIPVTLRGHEIEHRVDFVVADVNWLPFATGRVSAVVTQYLMDVLADPLHVAREIRRILKPGGVWINFSNPFPLPDEPTTIGRPGIDELADILRPLGWGMERCERRQFSWLNTDDLTPFGDRSIQDVHFFAARKLADSSITDAELPGVPHLDWDCAPKRSVSREIHFAHKRTPRNDGTVNTVLEAQLQRFGNLPMSPQAMVFFEHIMKSADGRRTVRDILAGIPSNDRLADGNEFLTLMQYLIRHHGLLSA